MLQKYNFIFKRLGSENNIKYILRKSSTVPVIAIRREDNAVWERRAPLAPSHVHSLVNDGVKVLVQPANKRAFPAQEYEMVGAEIQEDLSSASVILGVKQVPIRSLISNKTYVFFSHTIKSQAENMPMLDAILNKNIRLIDYEKMEMSDGKRVVAFGKYAGYAGMINILHGIGLRLLALGHHTPFMHIGIAHNYRTSGQAIQAVRDAGYEISMDRMPASIGPMIFIFTGTGNVSKGAQDVFRELPCLFVEPRDLKHVAEHGDTRVVYGCVVDMHHHLRRIADCGFDHEEYFDKPYLYESVFAEEIAPYASCIINGIFWRPQDPRLLAKESAAHLQTTGFPKLSPVMRRFAIDSPGCPRLPQRLIAICDISADPGGSIEFMTDCTTIDAPFDVFNPASEELTTGVKGDGILICSVDNLPAQLPREATQFFGDHLLPFMSDLIRNDATTPFEDTEGNISPVVRNAVIASNGRLTPKYEYINEMRARRKKEGAAMSSSTLEKHKVLVLGAGFVSHPVIDYITRFNDTAVTVVSALDEEVRRLTDAKFKHTSSVTLDVMKETERLIDLVKGHDAVVSLLPYTMHHTICELCVEHKKDLITASYVSPDVEKFHQRAVDAGISIVMEMGVDPGVDHMLAMECFDEIQAKGGKITSFVSWCGGLPAPEDSDNPLRYKFSWSPQGVLMVTLSPAKYLWNGEIVERAAGENYKSGTLPISFMPAFNLEGLPNRDSTVYKKQYGLSDAHTIIRGTLRYKGFTEVIVGMQELGLINTNQHPMLVNEQQVTWKELLANIVGVKKDCDPATLRGLVYDATRRSDVTLNALESLDLLNDTPIAANSGTTISALAQQLALKLAYQPDEKDMVIMRHEVGAIMDDGSHIKHDVDFVVYGDVNGYSAMAKGVGYPCAVATRKILMKKFSEKGIVTPMKTATYQPILKELRKLGLRSKTTVTYI